MRLSLRKDQPPRSDAGVGVGHGHGTASLPEPCQQGLDGEVLSEGPGAEALGLERGPVLGHGFRLVVGGVNPLVGLNVALHCLSERGGLPPA